MKRMPILPFCPAIPSATKPYFQAKPLLVKYLLLVTLEQEDIGENLEEREDQLEEVFAQTSNHHLANGS